MLTAIQAFFKSKLFLEGLIAVVVAVAIAYTCYTTGWNDRDQIAAQDRIEQVEQAFEDYSVALKEQRKEDAARYARDSALMADFAAQNKRLSSISTTLTGRLNDLSEASSTVRLSVGALRLLNEARADPNNPGGTVPGAAGGVAYSDPTPSGVGLPDLIGSDVQIAAQYNAMRLQCNALISWSQRELIDANKKRIGN